MVRFIFACALAAVALGCYAQPRNGNREGLLSEGEGPQFRCQLGQRLGPEADSLRLIAAISVPYDNLVFLRADTGFAASFELVTTVYSDGGGLFAERIATEDVVAETFIETNSRIRNAVHVEEFLVPPGKYKVRVTLTQGKEAPRRAKWEGGIELAASDARLRVSDIYWVTEDVSLAELGVPRLVESFSTSEDSAQARVQLYSSVPGDLVMHWILLGEEKDTVNTASTRLPADGTVQTVEYTLQIHTLPAQSYILRLIVQAAGREETRDRGFYVRIPGVPLSITDLDLAVRQLRYIASGEEWSKLRGSSGAERERLFKDFWKRRDPTPNTEENELMDEYFKRVEYADAKFSANRAGWESDRGRIYILYGEPTDIERHPFEANSRPYEVWYYTHITRRFVFVDYTGFGDYSLASPEWGY